MEQVMILLKKQTFVDNYPYQTVFVFVGISHSVWYCLQILGAFADRDGAPLQGMKIKSVVPGKNRFSLELFGAVARLHVPRHSLLRHSRLALIL